MATYNIYDNILIKLESVFLRVEGEVDKEITALLTEHKNLNQNLTDLKGKVEVLNCLKRSFDLYCNKEDELQQMHSSLLTVLCEKQIILRFIQEKELLLNGYLIHLADQALPSLVQLNKEFKIRKQLQEIELLGSYLAQESRFSDHYAELEKANEIFDLGVESGATDKLEGVIILFNHLFEKILHIYPLSKEMIKDFKTFRSQVMLQANQVAFFTKDEVKSLETLQRAFRQSSRTRIALECEIDKLLYQFCMLKNGQKIIQAEIKNASGELESILFKEYAIKQKIEELRQYKTQLNHQKDNFMKDPTVDGYTEAVAQLENVEQRFRRLLLHKDFDKSSLAYGFFANKRNQGMEAKQKVEHKPYNKNLFQLLHNSHISSEDKMLILRLSKPSKLINAQTGKFFYQRASKNRSLHAFENAMTKIQMQDLH